MFFLQLVRNDLRSSRMESVGPAVSLAGQADLKKEAG
jgi:hypothetical protein